MWIVDKCVEEFAHKNGDITYPRFQLSYEK